MTEEEWQSLYQRSLVLPDPATDPPPAPDENVATPLAAEVHAAVGAEDSAEAEAGLDAAAGAEHSAGVEAGLDAAAGAEESAEVDAAVEGEVEAAGEVAADAGMAPAAAAGADAFASLEAELTGNATSPWWTRSRRKGEASAPAALTEEEWRGRFFQRGQLTGLLEGDDQLILTAPDVTGGVTSLRLQGDALMSVAAAAMNQHVAGFDWRDHDDLVLLGIVLFWCLRGIPLESRPPELRDAVAEMAERYSGLIDRVAALLPSR